MGFLSLCMIVKNEEKVLRRCLDSVADGVDEIIIVDTGSSDGTKKIAQQFTKHIYDYEWKNDFSDARNFAQSKASGKWILVLDADEFVYIENLKEARKQLMDQREDYDAYDVTIYNFTGNQGQFTMQHRHTRIYRNAPQIKYRRTIHEQIYKNNEHLDAGLSQLILYHSGYLTYMVHEKKKRTRNKKLIEKEVYSNGQSGFDYFNFANEYASSGDFEKGLQYYIEAFNHKPALQYSWVSHCIVQIINCLINLNRYRDALNVIYDSETIYKHSPDFQALKAHVYLLQGRFEDSEKTLVNLIDSSAKYEQAITSPDYLNFLPYKWLGIIYEEKKNSEKAIYYYSKAFQYNAYDDSLVKNYFSLFMRTASVRQIEQFIRKEHIADNEIKTYRLIRTFLQTPSLYKLATYLSKQKQNFPFNDNGLDLKLLMLNGKCDEAYNNLKSLTLQNLIQIVNHGLFDFYDFVLLCIKYQNFKMLENFKKIFPSSQKVIDLVLNSTEESNEDHLPIYLSLLERSLMVNQFKVFEQLLALSDSFGQNVKIKIGHLLYTYQFVDLAIQFYQEAGDENFDEQTYLNIIKEFKKQNMLRDAFQFALQALNKGYKNFSLIKDTIEIANKLNDEEIQKAKSDLVKSALHLYPDSMEMQKILFNNR